MNPKAPRLDEALLPTVLELVPAAVIVLDREARVQLFNAAAERVSGYSRHEVMSRPIWSLLDPADEPAARALFEELREGSRQHTERAEVGWISRDGERRDLSWSASVLADHAGELRLLVCAAVDLTELRALKDREKSMEAARAVDAARREALESSRARFSGIVQLASDAIISVDADQRITLFNQGAEEIFGWSADEIVGEPLGRLVPERIRETHRRHVEEFGRSRVQSRRMGEREGIFGLRKSGEEFPAEASILKLDVDGERIYTAVVRDVSEQRRREQQQAFLVEVGKLLASSLELDTTLSAIADAAVGFLADYCVVDLIEEDGGVRRIRVATRDGASAEAADVLRAVTLDRSEPHLMSQVLETRRPQLVATVNDELLRGLAQGETHLAALRAMDMASYMVVPLMAREGMLGTVLLVASGGRPTYDEQDLDVAVEVGSRAGLAVENARLYRNQERAISARDDILGVVSHDLGNPLQAVFIGLEALERSLDVSDDADAGEERGSGYYLSAIRHSAERMQRLIHELLEVRRMEEGHLELELELHSMEPLVAEALQLVEPLALVKSVILTDGVKGTGLPPVRVDRDRMLQVLSNLVGNAVKHTPEGGRVRVSADALAGELQVSVHDTGPGIPEDHRDQVFDRFWRAEKTGGKGIGLGLAIAKGIVRSHEGRIWVESEEGVGSDFHFTLPLSSSTE